MKARLATLAVAVLLLACGGSKEDSSSSATAQGAAKLWLAAAVSSNAASLAELSTDDFKDKAPGYAAEIREKFTSVEDVLWGGSGKEGADYAWTATGAGGVVFFKVRESSANQFRVSDVQTSW